MLHTDNYLSNIFFKTYNINKTIHIVVKYIIYTIYSVNILEQYLAFSGQILFGFPGIYERVVNEGFSAIQRLFHFLCDFLD